MECFCDDFDTVLTAKIVGISRQKLSRYFGALRFRIMELSQLEGKFSGEIEVDESYFGAKRIRGKRGRGARGKNHINGIEIFWSFVKRRMAKQNGVRKDKFLLHLKDSEFRWNHRNEMYKVLLDNLKSNPLSL